MATHTTPIGLGYVDGITLPKAIYLILRGTRKPRRFSNEAHARQWFVVDEIYQLVEKVQQHNAKENSQPRPLSRRDYPTPYRDNTHLFTATYERLCSTIGVSIPKTDCTESLKKGVTRIMLTMYKPERKVGKKGVSVSSTQLALFG